MSQSKFFFKDDISLRDSDVAILTLLVSAHAFIHILPCNMHMSRVISSWESRQPLVLNEPFYYQLMHIMMQGVTMKFTEARQAKLCNTYKNTRHNVHQLVIKGFSIVDARCNHEVY